MDVKITILGILAILTIQYGCSQCVETTGSNLVQNGTFEAGFVPVSPGFKNVVAGETTITGWTVVGNVDFENEDFDGCFPP